MVCQHNLLFGSYKFRDNAENGKFILLLNRNTGVTAVQEIIILTGIFFKVAIKVKIQNQFPEYFF